MGVMGEKEKPLYVEGLLFVVVRLLCRGGGDGGDCCVKAAAASRKYVNPLVTVKTVETYKRLRERFHSVVPPLFVLNIFACSMNLNGDVPPPPPAAPPISPAVVATTIPNKATMVLAAFNFPCHETWTTFLKYRWAIHSLNAETATSRATMMVVGIATMYDALCTDNKIRHVVTNNLSATGSKNAPHELVTCHRRANHPSRQSDKAAMNKNKDVHRDDWMKEMATTGTNNNRK